MADEKTFFRAQPTAAQTQINWAEVGANFSNMLNEEARVREEKKDAIDEASRQYQKTLNEVEQGESPNANQWWLEGSGVLQDQSLMLDRMLKTGELKPKDYTKMRQNLTDGTDGLIGVFNKFNTEYKERMDRFENNESQDLEPFMMATLENFGNFQKTAIVVNPETSVLSVADIDPVTKNVINDPNKIRSVSSLNNLIARRYDKYNLDAVTSQYAESVGIWQKIERSIGSQNTKGLIKTLSDPMAKQYTPKELEALGMTPAQAVLAAEELNVYKANEDRLVSDIMSVWSNTSSILTNTINFAPNGKEYGYTFNEDREENEILLKNDDQGQVYAVYTDDQKKNVEKVVRDSVRDKLDKKVTTSVVADYTTRPNQQEINRGRTIAKQKDILTNVYQLYSGDTGDAQEAARFLAGNNPAIREIERTNDGVTITFTNERVEPLTFGAMDEAAWATSSLAFFIPEGNVEIDIEEQRKVALGDSDGKLATAKVLPEKVTYESNIKNTSPDNIEEIVINDIAKGIPSDFFFGQKVKDVEYKIGSIVAPLGIRVDGSEMIGRNNLNFINDATGAQKQFNTNWSSMDKAESEMAKVLTWINSQINKENSEGYLRMVTPTKEEDTGTVTPNLAP